MPKRLDSSTAEFRIYNTSMKLKKAAMNCARSEGKTLTQWTIYHFKKIVESYPESSRNYNDDYDGC